MQGRQVRGRGVIAPVYRRPRKIVRDRGARICRHIVVHEAAFSGRAGGHLHLTRTKGTNKRLTTPLNARFSPKKVCVYIRSAIPSSLGIFLACFTATSRMMDHRGGRLPKLICRKDMMSTYAANDEFNDAFGGRQTQNIGNALRKSGSEFGSCPARRSDFRSGTKC